MAEAIKQALVGDGQTLRGCLGVYNGSKLKMKNFDGRVKRLEEKIADIVVQRFLKRFINRLRNAKNDEQKILIAGEWLEFKFPVGWRGLDGPTLKTILAALPKDYADAIRCRLGEMAAAAME